MVSVKRATLEGLLDAAKNTYPNEFFALLGSRRRNNIVDEVVVVPAVYGKRHALVKTGLVPLDFNILGSIHSHPGPSNRPSKADLHSFPRFGSVHLIIALPFTMETVRAYDARGKEIDLEVVE